MANGQQSCKEFLMGSGISNKLWHMNGDNNSLSVILVSTQVDRDSPTNPLQCHLLIHLLFRMNSLINSLQSSSQGCDKINRWVV